MSGPSAPLLKACGLNVSFGGVAALSDVDLTLSAGEVVGIIGPNGAGKSTLFNALTGLTPLQGGTVHLQGEPLRRPWRRRHAAAAVLLATCVAALTAIAAIGPEALWRVACVAPYQVHLVAQEQSGADDAALAAQPHLGARCLDLLVGAPQLGASRRGYLVLDGAGHVLGEPSMRLAAAQAARAPAAARARAAGLRPLLRMAALAAAAFVAGLGVYWRLFARNRSTASYIAQAGIARTFQNLRLFGQMSVLDNVQVAWRGPGLSTRVTWARGVALGAILWALGAATAVLSRNPSHEGEASITWSLAVALTLVLLVRAAWHKPAHATASNSPGAMQTKAAMDLLRRVGLGDAAHTQASALAYGDMRRLEIARALATRPKVLLLDEPAAGMNATETQSLRALIHALRQDGPAILLIEHDMALVMDLADRVVVLEYGRKIADGLPEAVQADPKVIGAYLGDADFQEGAHAPR